MRIIAAVVIGLLTSSFSLNGQTGDSDARTSPANQDLRTRLQVASVVHFPDGRTVWGATPWRAGEGPSFSGALYTTETLCVFQPNKDDPTKTRGYGWEFSVGLTDAPSDGLLVRIVWRQTAPESAAGAERTRELSLRPGDSIPIDTIRPGPVAPGRSCDATKMELEVRLCGGSPNPCTSGR